MQVDAGVCDACRIHRAIGVASLPFAPMSVSFCSACLLANNHPYWILVCNTAMIGGLDNSNLDWRQMVETSLAYQGKTLTEFNADVEHDIYLMEKDIANE